MLDFIFPRKLTEVAFVISCPRSGSTWLKAAINGHPEAHCTEHRLYGPYCDIAHDGASRTPRLRVTLDAYVAALAKSLEIGQGAAPELLEQLTRTLASSLMEFERKTSGKKCIVDKVTPYRGTAEHVVQQTLTHFPEAKLIHLYRDGRDVATSGVFHALNRSSDEREPEESQNRRRFFGEASSRGVLRRFFSDEELQHWARHWDEVSQAVLAVERTQAIHRVAYEQMLEQHAETLRVLLGYIGLDANPAIVEACVVGSTFEAMSGGRPRGSNVPNAHVRNGESGNWKEYFTRRDGQLFHDIAGNSLAALGYESDDRWIEQLPVELELTRARDVGSETVR